MNEATFPPLVAEAVDRVRGGATPSGHLHAMVEELAALPDAEVVSSLIVRCKEFEITIGQWDYLEQTIAALTSLRPLGLSAAPTFVDCMRLSEHAYDGVLIVRYAACPGERLIPAKKTKGPFREDAARRFIAEMELLATHGKVHPYARGVFHWLVSSETGTLMMERWSVLRDASPQERQEMLETIREIIEERKSS